MKAALVTLFGAAVYLLAHYLPLPGVDMAALHGFVDPFGDGVPLRTLTPLAVAPSLLVAVHGVCLMLAPDPERPGRAELVSLGIFVLIAIGVGVRLGQHLGDFGGMEAAIGVSDAQWAIPAAVAMAAAGVWSLSWAMTRFGVGHGALVLFAVAGGVEAWRRLSTEGAASLDGLRTPMEAVVVFGGALLPAAIVLGALLTWRPGLPRRVGGALFVLGWFDVIALPYVVGWGFDGASMLHAPAPSTALPHLDWLASSGSIIAGVVALCVGAWLRVECRRLDDDAYPTRPV